MKLDLGCGNKKRQGYIGIDINPLSDADTIHDLNAFPYPFQDNKFDEILCDNVIEHLENVISVMEELWRIAEAGGKIVIIVPYFRSHYAFIDPTHKHFFTTMSFNYFDGNHLFSSLYKYSRARFEIRSIRFDEGYLHKNYLMRLFVKVVNRHLSFYESILSHWLPLNTLTFELIVQK